MKKTWNWFKGMFGIMCWLVAFIATELLITTNYWAQWFPALMAQAWAPTLLTIALTFLFMLGSYTLYQTTVSGRAGSRSQAVIGWLIALAAFAILNAKGLGYLNGYIPGMSLYWLDGLVWFAIYSVGISGVLLLLWARPPAIVREKKVKKPLLKWGKSNISAGGNPPDVD